MPGGRFTEAARCSGVIPQGDELVDGTGNLGTFLAHAEEVATTQQSSRHTSSNRGSHSSHRLNNHEGLHLPRQSKGR
jgi:hypothetical protein